MDDVTIHQIPPLLLGIVAMQTEMDPLYQKRISGMIERHELVLFAAKRGDRYIGRVGLWLALPDEDEVRREIPGVPMMSSLHVNERARLQGTARKLMEAAETEALRRGNVQIGLGVEPKNMPARKLYESLGYQYRRTADKPTYQSCWDELGRDRKPKKVCIDVVLMVKELGE